MSKKSKAANTETSCIHLPAARRGHEELDQRRDKTADLPTFLGRSAHFTQDVPDDSRAALYVDLSYCRALSADAVCGTTSRVDTSPLRYRGFVHSIRLGELFYVGTKVANNAATFLRKARKHFKNLGIRVTVAVTDSSREFNSVAFKQACAKLGIEQVLAMPTPTRKAKYERWQISEAQSQHGLDDRTHLNVSSTSVASDSKGKRP